MYIYIYIYIYRERERDVDIYVGSSPSAALSGVAAFSKGYVAQQQHRSRYMYIKREQDV